MKKTPDFILIIVTLALLTIGMIMVYSASAVWASYKMGDSFFFAKRQLLFASLGVVAMFSLMKIDYWVWRTYSKVILLVCFVLLILVLIPGVGLVRGGARSWIGIGSIFYPTVRVYEIRDDYFLSKIFSGTTKINYIV